MTTNESDVGGTIRIARRQILKDILRRYTVFIDSIPVAELAAFQTVSYPVKPGGHSVQLRIMSTGSSCSDQVPVFVSTNEIKVLRTKSLGFKKIILAPLGIFNPNRFAPRPWIQLEVDASHT